jgi:8-oxo-dGTP pyrophosphatase MutT (NUDIX family)
VKKYRPRVEVIVMKPDGSVYTGRGMSRNVNFPGGGIDGDESPADAGIRELLEETGIVAVNPRMLSSVVFREWGDEEKAFNKARGRDYVGSETHYILADYASMDEKAQLENWRATERGWYKPSELLKWPKPASERTVRCSPGQTESESAKIAVSQLSINVGTVTMDYNSGPPQPRADGTLNFITGLAKLASVTAAGGVPVAGYGGYHGLSFQPNLPISPRRELTPVEMADVTSGQTKWLHGPFASEGDSISRRMASPLKQSVLAALATTAAGAGLGAYASSQGGGSTVGGALAGGGAGLLAGVPLGTLAYLMQQQSNKTLEERMRRLPEGNTTIRDMMSDPVTGYGERVTSMRNQLNPSFNGLDLAQLAAAAAQLHRSN